MKYGLEKLNADVAAWMRGDSACDGSHAAPPYLAMGDASSVMWNRQVLRPALAGAERTASLCGEPVAVHDADEPDRLAVVDWLPVADHGQQW